MGNGISFQFAFIRRINSNDWLLIYFLFKNEVNGGLTCCQQLRWELGFRDEV